MSVLTESGPSDPPIVAGPLLLMTVDECNKDFSTEGRIVCEAESCDCVTSRSRSLFASKDEAVGERGSVEGKMRACIHRMSNVISTTVNMS